jgi:hypothetical protein
MRNALIVLWMLLGSTSAAAQVSVGVWLPGVSIGINMPVYPTLVLVPGYPVYYAPQLNSNYFFYDGMYWVYVGDNWYASSWYNGPWILVAPPAVPVFILRVPVYYYRQPPVYFRAWSPQAPPRWGEHWGSAWEQRRRGWDNWNRSAVPPPAPLPVYQRQYEGNRYPRAEQQQTLQSQHYRYQPRDTEVKRHYQAQRTQTAPVTSTQGGKGAPEQKATTQDRGSSGRPSSAQQGTPPAARGQPPQKGGGDNQKSATAQTPSRPGAPPAQYQSQPPQQGAAQRDQQAPRSQGQDKGQQDKGQQDKEQDKGSAKEPRQGQEKGK